MTRNLKVLGLALLAVAALSAVAVQGASATTFDDLHSDGLETVITGKNVEGNTKFAVGSAGTVECTKAEFESTATGHFVSAGTYSSEALTVTPHYTGCTFGGQPATVNFNHCATVLYFATTPGNSDGGEHANVETECSGGTIEIDTSVCTVTIAAQTVNHAVRYENDPSSQSAFIVKTTGKKIVVNKTKTTESQTGCLLFPTGAIGTVTGTATYECFKDVAAKTLEGTARTTPTGLTEEGGTTQCSITTV